MAREVVTIEEERKGINASFYLDKEIQIYINDKDRVQRRDGILRGVDSTHYHVEMLLGPKKGLIVSFLRSDVKRVEPQQAGGVTHE